MLLDTIKLVIFTIQAVPKIKLCQLQYCFILTSKIILSHYLGKENFDLINFLNKIERSIEGFETRIEIIFS